MPRKVLVVEDERDTGEILAGLLRRWGYEPTVLTEGKPAVTWVQQHRPDLILLDLLLPDIHGYNICETLKLERDTNLIPIVMVTALTAPEDRIKGLQVGANRYLTKPFTADQLHQTIEEALAWKEDLQSRGTEGMIRFHLQSDTQYLEELNHLLSALFLFSGLNQTQAKQLATAVREMGTNAIEWGHRKQADRIVTVDYTIDAEKITILIRDTGPGFDPAHLPHAAQPEDPIGHLMVRETLGLREGGFGILMARGLVDELQYNDKGNEVRLVKYFPYRNGDKPAAGPLPDGSPNGSAG
jgi:CheY-like chemotaxis protein/anti-sigma regulatory factor (Ser/Thr protein kinase)